VYYVCGVATVDFISALTGCAYSQNYYLLRYLIASHSHHIESFFVFSVFFPSANLPCQASLEFSVSANYHPINIWTKIFGKKVLAEGK
jgi:hypothetical protein